MQIYIQPGHILLAAFVVACLICLAINGVKHYLDLRSTARNATAAIRGLENQLTIAEFILVDLESNETRLEHDLDWAKLQLACAAANQDFSTFHERGKVAVSSHDGKAVVIPMYWGD